MREAFDHRPPSWISQSRKYYVQSIHNHMVVHCRPNVKGSSRGLSSDGGELVDAGAEVDFVGRAVVQRLGAAPAILEGEVPGDRTAGIEGRRNVPWFADNRPNAQLLWHENLQGIGRIDVVVLSWSAGVATMPV
jgi:hypothetical protein